MCVHIIELKINVKKCISGFLRLYGVPLVLALVNEVEDAFSNHSAVLSAFSFLDPSHLPEEAKDVHDYGKVNHFKILYLYFFFKQCL